jgi:hypothetical protein
LSFAYFVISFLLISNILLFHGQLFVNGYYWTYRKLFKPKFKVSEIVIVKGQLFEIIHISTVARPYSYFCLPLNKNSNILSTYYPQKELKAISALTKALF